MLVGMGEPYASDSAHDLAILIDVARQLGSTYELPALLKRIEIAARRALDCDRASVLLYDRPNHELYSLVATGVESLRFSAETGIAGEAARTGQPIVVPDAYADDRFNRAIDEQTGYTTRNLLTFPLVGHEGHVVGVLQVLNKQRGAFTPADVNLADALSKLVGVAVERQMLLEEYREKCRIEHDLSVAREIQQRLLPPTSPIVDGFDVAGWNRPADETGGDCFDYFTLDDARLVILVADATGHGIGPALIISQCRAMLRGVASFCDDVARIARHVNGLLHQDLPDDRFVTAFIGILDPRTQCLTYVSAGHGPLLHYHARTGETDELHATGMPMGILPQQDFDVEGPRRIEPGDVFALITDGFFEWAAPNAEQFGIERVAEVVRAMSNQPAADIIHALHERVRAFSQGTPQRDDLTAVILRRA